MLNPKNTVFGATIFLLYAIRKKNLEIWQETKNKYSNIRLKKVNKFGELRGF